MSIVFALERTNQLSLLPDKDLVDVCPPIEPYQVTKNQNREKARIKVAKIHAQITDNRKDHLHKLTTQLVRENQTIVVENLAVKNLVKKPKLSQAISDVSWGEITRQLAYKCRWYGRNYIEIDRAC